MKKMLSASRLHQFSSHGNVVIVLMVDKLLVHDSFVSWLPTLVNGFDQDAANCAVAIFLFNENIMSVSGGKIRWKSPVLKLMDISFLLKYDRSWVTCSSCAQTEDLLLMMKTSPKL